MLKRYQTDRHCNRLTPDTHDILLVWTVSNKSQTGRTNQPSIPPQLGTPTRPYLGTYLVYLPTATHALLSSVRSFVRCPSPSRRNRIALSPQTARTPELGFTFGSDFFPNNHNRGPATHCMLQALDGSTPFHCNIPFFPFASTDDGHRQSVTQHRSHCQTKLATAQLRFKPSKVSSSAGLPVHSLVIAMHLRVEMYLK
ncbi:hypothetical protein LZ31DRAFT_88432 [Colletotrichum somersetense]|nr:hypothetical protein LZ31DRAFT_88432 [Colletotrichum somersetense]